MYVCISYLYAPHLINLQRLLDFYDSTVQGRNFVSNIFANMRIFHIWNVHFELCHVVKFHRSKPLKKEGKKLKRARRTIKKKRISNPISAFLKNCEMALTTFRLFSVRL